MSQSLCVNATFPTNNIKEEPGTHNRTQNVKGEPGTSDLRARQARGVAGFAEGGLVP